MNSKLIGKTINNFFFDLNYVLTSSQYSKQKNFSNKKIKQSKKWDDLLKKFGSK